MPCAAEPGAPGYQPHGDVPRPHPCAFDVTDFAAVTSAVEAEDPIDILVNNAMIERGWGRLVTIVSDAGRTGDAGGAAYSAAKAGSAGLTRALALENGRYGITANNISLGTMRTPATESLWADPDDDFARSILRSYVVRRPGDPDEVAGLAVYLASDLAAWITGQTYPLNGGYSFAL